MTKRTATRAYRKPDSLSADALMLVVARELRSAGSSLTVSAVQKRVKGAGHAATTQAVKEALERLVREGQAYHHPGATAKSALSYGVESPRDLVAALLNDKVRLGAEHTLAKLRGVVPKAYKDLVDEAIGVLLREGRLFEKPGTGKTVTYTTQRLPPTSALTATQRKSLEAILGRVNALRWQPLALSQLLAFLDGSAPAPPAPPPATRATAPTLDALEALYRLDLPSRGGLTSMPIPLTWRRYAASVQAQGSTPDRAAFERVLLEGGAQGRIEITVHEWPSTLSPEDAAAAIRQPDGRVLYYWRPIRER